MKLLINKTQTNLMIIKYCNQCLKTFMSIKKPPNQVAFLSQYWLKPITLSTAPSAPSSPSSPSTALLAQPVSLFLLRPLVQGLYSQSIHYLACNFFEYKITYKNYKPYFTNIQASKLVFLR